MTEPRGTIRPVITPLDEEAAVWFLGQRSWLRDAAAETGGSLGLVEQVIEAGFATPYHVHHAEDEAFYILEGDVSFVSGETLTTVGSGGLTFLPRDIPHGSRVEGCPLAHLHDTAGSRSLPSTTWRSWGRCRAERPRLSSGTARSHGVDSGHQRARGRSTRSAQA